MDTPTAPSVAGAYAPAFVERASDTTVGISGQKVSPELMLRPSLSDGGDVRVVYPPHDVSPELMLRPSLSGP